MDKSEEQFQELIANLTVRVNKALEKQGELPCIGLLLSPDNNVEVVIAQVEEGGVNAELEFLQRSLIDEAKQRGSVAACLSYPDYKNEEVVAYLENTEYYCSKCRIPVVANPALSLDIDNIEIEDGTIFVFGEQHG